MERAQRLELPGTTWNALRAPGTAACGPCIVRWQDGIAPYSISVLISIAQHILIFVPSNRPVAYLLQTYCSLSADLTIRSFFSA